jgi:hypothetical protein
MKYLKSFEKFTPIVGTGQRPELDGELVSDDEEIVYPWQVEITGHIETPIRNMKKNKLGKNPGTKLKKAAPTYPDIQKRNDLTDVISGNDFPSQS